MDIERYIRAADADESAHIAGVIDQPGTLEPGREPTCSPCTATR